MAGLSDVDVSSDSGRVFACEPAPVRGDSVRTCRTPFSGGLQNNSVTAGDLAVTVGYSDGTEIQILPAIRTNSGVRIAEPGSTGGATWRTPRDSPRTQLSQRGKNGRVVPTIKLAKAIADCFIRRPSRKITGYHMESLAVEAFSDYEGPLDPKNMLIHLLGHSMEAVMSPINRFHRAVHDMWTSILVKQIP